MSEEVVLLEGVPVNVSKEEIKDFLGCNVHPTDIIILRDRFGGQDDRCYVKVDKKELWNALDKNGELFYIKCGRVKVEESKFDNMKADVDRFGEYIDRGENSSRVARNSTYVLMTGVPFRTKFWDIENFFGGRNTVKNWVILNSVIGIHSGRVYIELCGSDVLTLALSKNNNSFYKAIKKITVTPSTKDDLDQHLQNEYKGIPFPLGHELEYPCPDRRVEVVGTFSLIDNEVVNIGTAKFRNYKPWNGEKIDLNEGFESPDNNEPIQPSTAVEQLLKWINYKDDDTENPYNMAERKVNFVGNIGVLRKMGFTLLRLKSSWECEVCRYKDIIYLSDRFIRRKVTNESELRANHWDYKFHDLLSGWDESFIGCPYTVCEFELPGIKCLIAGQVDCVNEAGEYVEISLCSKKEIPELVAQSWLHAYIGGNQRLVHGVRGIASYENLVTEVNDDKLEDIPRKYEDGTWKATAMLGHIHDVLCSLQDRVQEGHTYIFRNSGEEEFGRSSYYITEAPAEHGLLDKVKSYIS